jgi:two-component SAPR family response regulator
MKNAVFGKTIALLAVYMYFITTVSAVSNKNGLEFVSFETAQEKRTSFNLTPSRPFSFPDGFIFSFDMSYQSSYPDHNFGYIFRLIGQNGKHIDFLMNLSKFTVVNSEGNILADCQLDDLGHKAHEFFSFSMEINIKRKTLYIQIANLEFKPLIKDIEQFSRVEIIFGRCSAPHLQSSDVPQITIRDVRLKNNDGEVLLHWILGQHTDKGVYDEVKHSFATVENPNWLLDAHFYWKRCLSFKTQNNPQITYNTSKRNIVIADKRMLYSFDTNQKAIVNSEPVSGVILSELVNQLAYNHLDNNYYTYSLGSSTGKRTAVYDNLSKQWQNFYPPDTYADFWHHNRLISDIDSCMYIFGGYGHHKYKNIINRYSFATGVWEEAHYKGDIPPPRYLSGLGVINSRTALLFGGYGSETGMQELTPHNFYDLYQIDLETFEARKLWELEQPSDNFVVANTLVVDTVHRFFYALCFPQQQYNTYLYLARFYIDKPEYEIVSDPIPFEFRDIISYADLFIDEVNDELFAITYVSEPSDSSSTVNIYNLSYPPVTETSIRQSENKDAGLQRFGIVLTVVLLSAGIFFIICKRKRLNEPAVKPTVEPEVKNNSSVTVSQINSPSIRLFGGFRVTDGNGCDLTAEFSPIVKQLFLLILLHTFNDNSKGVSSTKLKDTLWIDKSVAKARNNRGVMLNRIRQILEQVGGVTIEGQNSYWSMRIEDDVYCDYREAIKLLDKLKKPLERTKEEVKRLIEIVSEGTLLPYTQVEWVDVFKADFANSLIDVLLDASVQNNLQLTNRELIELADAVSVHDILNEEALKLKCQSLVKMGKLGIAKSTYITFAKEYSILFGTIYPTSFEMIVS